MIRTSIKQLHLKNMNDLSIQLCHYNSSGTIAYLANDDTTIMMNQKSYDYTPMRPIPLTERLPQPYDPESTRPQDCDPTGRCWALKPKGWYGGTVVEVQWTLVKPSMFSLFGTQFWLPWWSLPLPQVESHAEVFPTPIAPIEALGPEHYSPEVES